MNCDSSWRVGITWTLWNEEISIREWTSWRQCSPSTKTELLIVSNSRSTKSTMNNENSLQKKNCFLIVKIWSNYHWKRLLYLRHEIRGRCCERPVYASMEFPLLQLELNEWIRIEKIIRESRVVNGALDLNWISVGSDFNYDYYKVVTSCLPHLW